MGWVRGSEPMLVARLCARPTRKIQSCTLWHVHVGPRSLEQAFGLARRGLGWARKGFGRARGLLVEPVHRAFGRARKGFGRAHRVLAEPTRLCARLGQLAELAVDSGSANVKVGLANRLAQLGAHSRLSRIGSWPSLLTRLGLLRCLSQCNGCASVRAQPERCDVDHQCNNSGKFRVKFLSLKYNMIAGYAYIKLWT